MGTPAEVKKVLKLEVTPQSEGGRGLSFGQLAKLLGVAKGTLHKFITDPDYIPRSDELKTKLGLDPGTEIIVQTVKRDPKGRWAKDD